MNTLFPDPTRLPYYIVAPNYTRVSAGIRVLHALCHLLNVRGHSAFIITSEVNPDFVTPILTQKIVEQHYAERRTPIVVYPETLWGNPLQANFVVRYMLNIPGLLGGPSDFPSSALQLWYTDGYRKACGATGPILFLPTVDARQFSPPSDQRPRKGSCFYAGKFRVFAGEPLPPLPEDSAEILRIGNGVQTQKEIVDLFQRSELFYCLESSALALEAILCGCPAVLIPNSHMPQFMPSYPFGNAGIAWGTSPKEIERAKQTVTEIPARYKLWIEQAFHQLDEFIEATQAKAGTMTYSNIIKLVDPFAPAIPQEQETNTRRVVKQLIPPIVLTARRKILGIERRKAQED